MYYSLKWTLLQNVFKVKVTDLNPMLAA